MNIKNNYLKLLIYAFVAISSAIFYPATKSYAIENQCREKTSIELRNFLSEKFPKITPTNITTLKPNIAYEIKTDNNTYVLKLEHQEYTFQQIQNLTDSFKDYTDFQLPEFILSKDNDCVLYKKIEGDVITKEMFDHMTFNQKEQLSKDLAKFIYQLHTFTKSQSGIDHLQITHEKNQTICNQQMKRVPSFEELNNDLQKYIFIDNSMDDLKDFWETFVLPKYKNAISDKRFHSIVHNDLQKDNFIIDKTSGHLTGVIDFSEYVYGNIIREMRHFYSISPEFMEQVARNYCSIAKIDDADSFIENVYVFRAYRDFTNLLKTKKYPNYASEEDKHSEYFLRALMNKIIL